MHSVVKTICLAFSLVKQWITLICQNKISKGEFCNLYWTYRIYIFATWKVISNEIMKIYHWNKGEWIVDSTKNQGQQIMDVINLE